MKAFPINSDVAEIEKWQGMDLRDWFAGKAMQAIVGRYGDWHISQKFISEMAYKQADSMMNYRGQK